MKKYSKYYIICWAIALAVFNVITFTLAGAVAKDNLKTSSFWIGYVFITLVFVGNLLCTLFVFKEDAKEKLFLNLSIIYYAYVALSVSLIAGAIAMAVPAIPYWVGIIVDVLILAFYAIAIVKAKAAVSVINDVEQKVKVQTSFIKLLTTDADSLRSRAKTDEAKALANKVYEVIRFSDPMSVPELMEIEAQIQNEFNTFSEAIKTGDDGLAKSGAQELINLIGDRNKKCKVLK